MGKNSLLKAEIQTTINSNKSTSLFLFWSFYHLHLQRNLISISCLFYPPWIVTFELLLTPWQSAVNNKSNNNNYNIDNNNHSHNNDDDDDDADDDDDKNNSR